MDDSTITLLALFTLVTIHAVISLFSASLQNIRRSVIDEMIDNGEDLGRRMLDLTEGRLRLPMTVNLAQLITRFGIATLITLVVIVPNADLPSTSLILLVVVTVLVSASVTMVLGDIVPEAIGTSYAESVARIAVNPLRGLIILMSPLTGLLLIASRGISRVFGSDGVVNRVTEEEIMTLINAGHSGGTIEEEEKAMIFSVLHLDETTARELMTPRMDIVGLDVTSTIQDALSAFVKSGFSRIPIYEESIDNIIGLLYAKDILSVLNNGEFGNKAISDLARPLYFVPETKRADDLLKELQERNVHLAIVVDEYGGTSGLVTIENLLEEIVGDIRDEYDIDEEDEYIESGNGEYMIDASMDLDDLNELLDVDIDTEDADTLGGYIFLALGRVPEEKEMIETDILTLTVMSIDGRRIRKVKVVKKEPQLELDTDSQPIVTTPEELKDETT